MSDSLQRATRRDRRSALCHHLLPKTLPSSGLSLTPRDSALFTSGALFAFKRRSGRLPASRPSRRHGRLAAATARVSKLPGAVGNCVTSDAKGRSSTSICCGVFPMRTRTGRMLDPARTLSRSNNRFTGRTGLTTLSLGAKTRHGRAVRRAGRTISISTCDIVASSTRYPHPSALASTELYLPAE